MNRRSNSRRMPISGSTRHDMSVATAKSVDVHQFVDLDDSQRTKFYQADGLHSRTPVIQPSPQGDKDFFGVSVTGYEPRIDHKGKKRTSSAPVCVVAVSGPVTVHHDWTKNASQDELMASKMMSCRQRVGDRGLVLHDTRPGKAMDIVLYDSFKRASKNLKYFTAVIS